MKRSQKKEQKKKRAFLPLLEEINSKRKNMTPRQRAIAEFIMTQPEHLAFMPIAELASKAGVSQATVIRFCNTLGYEGYSQMTDVVQKAIQLEYDSTDRFSLGMMLEDVSEKKRDDSVFSRMVQSEMENILNLSESVKASDFSFCVERTLQSDRVAIIGCMSTKCLAMYMHDMLVKVIDNVDLINQKDIHTSAACRKLNKNSIVYLFSFPRYPQDGLDIARIAAENGALVVVITDNTWSPAVQVADKSFYVNVKVLSFVDGYAAVMALINALVTDIGLQLADKSHDALAFYDSFVSKLRIFAKKTGQWRPPKDG